MIHRFLSVLKRTYGSLGLQVDAWRIHSLFQLLCVRVLQSGEVNISDCKALSTSFLFL